MVSKKIFKQFGIKTVRTKSHLGLESSIMALGLYYIITNPHPGLRPVKRDKWWGTAQERDNWWGIAHE